MLLDVEARVHLGNGPPGLAVELHGPTVILIQARRQGCLRSTGVGVDYPITTLVLNLPYRKLRNEKANPCKLQARAAVESVYLTCG